MRPFILLDLYSQADYIPPEVRSWPKQRALDWMRQYGEVEEWLLPDGEMDFVFRAPSGLITGFLLTEYGTLRIYLGDHSLRWVWK